MQNQDCHSVKPLLDNQELVGELLIITENEYYIRFKKQAKYKPSEIIGCNLFFVRL